MDGGISYTMNMNIISLIEEILPELKPKRIKKTTQIKLEGLLLVLSKLPLEEVKTEEVFNLLLVLQNKKLSKKTLFLINHLSYYFSTPINKEEEWQGLKEIFDGDETIQLFNGEIFDIDDLKYNNIKQFKSTFRRSNDSLHTKVTEVIYHSNNKMEFNTIYNLQNKTPNDLPNLFTDFARKFLNDIDDEEKNEAAR